MWQVRCIACSDIQPLCADEYKKPDDVGHLFRFGSAGGLFLIHTKNIETENHENHSFYQDMLGLAGSFQALWQKMMSQHETRLKREKKREASVSDLID